MLSPDVESQYSIRSSALASPSLILMAFEQSAVLLAALTTAMLQVTRATGRNPSVIFRPDYPEAAIQRPIDINTGGDGGLAGLVLAIC